MTKNIARTTDHPYIDKLIERMGAPAAARAIGLSNTGLAPSSMRDGVRVAFELAAQAVWLRDYEPNDRKHSHLMVKVPHEKEEAVKTMLTAFECKFVEWRFK